MRAVTRYASIVALSIAASLTLGATAQADPAKCQLEISKAFPKFVHTKIKALQKCNDKIVKGDIAGPCPNAETTLKIQGAESKLRAAGMRVYQTTALFFDPALLASFPDARPINAHGEPDTGFDWYRGVCPTQGLSR